MTMCTHEKLCMILQNAALCPEFPILSYTVVVEDMYRNRTVYISSATMDVSIALLEDMHYSFFVVVTNQFGNSSGSTPVTISEAFVLCIIRLMILLLILVTTDVQNVRICRVEDSNSYLIQCGYVTGSDARGCVYVTRGGDVMGNVTGTIARSNSAGVTVELTGSIYTDLLAYDWESEDSVSSLPIIVNISDATINACNATTTTGNTTNILYFHEDLTTSISADSDTTVVITAVALFFSTAVVLILLFIFGSVLCASKSDY